MHLPHAVWMNFLWTTCWWHILQDILGAPWLQNLILAVTAAIGLWTLGASSSQERRRATVDTLLEVLDDKDYLDARRKVRKLIEAGLNIPLLLSKEGVDDRRLVLSILNRYEFMATGLRERAFDTKIYQRMYHSNVVTDWNGLEAFVMALREDRQIYTLFQELEQLILKWKKHPLRVYKNTKPSKKITPGPETLAQPTKGTASSATRSHAPRQDTHPEGVRGDVIPPVPPKKQ